MRWLLAFLLGCSAEGPLTSAQDAGSEDVAPIHSDPVGDDTAPGPCMRETKVLIGETTVSMPIPCREFDERVDLGRPW